MPQPTIEAWPSRQQDLALTEALARYRRAFEADADGERRPLITRINPRDPTTNMLFVSLPAGDAGKQLLDTIEYVVEKLIVVQCEPGDVQLVERDYSA